MSDRMSLIEIDWCNTFGCDGPAAEDPDKPGTCDECGQPLVRVKVVRADVLAVSALAKADAEVTALADALRAAGVAPTMVQAIIDGATPRGQ